MGLLASSAVGGLGEGLMLAGKQLGDYAAHSALLKESSEFQKLRDERMNEFTAGENAKSREQATTLQAAGFEHAEKLQQQLKDFQSLEHGMDREQRLQLHEQTMAQLKAQFKNQGLTLQADKDGNLGVADMKNNSFTLLAGADGQPVKGQKSEDSIKLMEAIGHALKSFDPMDPSTKDIRERLANALMTTLGSKTGAPAPAAPGNRPPLDSFAKGGKGGANQPAGSGLLSSAAPATPREQDPVQAAQLRREAEMRAEYEKEQEEKRKKGEQYQKDFRDNLDRTSLRSGM